jgi:hypothetical protein
MELTRQGNEYADGLANPTTILPGESSQIDKQQNVIRTSVIVKNNEFIATPIVSGTTRKEDRPSYFYESGNVESMDSVDTVLRNEDLDNEQTDPEKVYTILEQLEQFIANKIVPEAQRISSEANEKQRNGQALSYSKDQLDDVIEELSRVAIEADSSIRSALGLADISDYPELEAYQGRAYRAVVKLGKDLEELSQQMDSSQSFDTDALNSSMQQGMDEVSIANSLAQTELGTSGADRNQKRNVRLNPYERPEVQTSRDDIDSLFLGNVPMSDTADQTLAPSEKLDLGPTAQGPAELVQNVDKFNETATTGSNELANTLENIAGLRAVAKDLENPSGRPTEPQTLELLQRGMAPETISETISTIEGQTVTRLLEGSSNLAKLVGNGEPIPMSENALAPRMATLMNREDISREELLEQFKMLLTEQKRLEARVTQGLKTAMAGSQVNLQSVMAVLRSFAAARPLYDGTLPMESMIRQLMGQAQVNVDNPPPMDPPTQGTSNPSTVSSGPANGLREVNVPTLRRRGQTGLTAPQGDTLHPSKNLTIAGTKGAQNIVKKPAGIRSIKQINKALIV